MMRLGKQFAQLGRTFLSPQKVTPLSHKLSYPFACNTPLIQKKYSHSQKSQTPSPKESSLNSLKNKDNGLIMTKPSPMFRPIKSLSRSRVPLQEFLLNCMQLVVIPYPLENLSLESMSMQQNQKEQDQNQLRKKKNLNQQLIHPNQHKLNKHPKKLPSKHPKQQTNQNKLPHHLHLLFSQDKENKLVNPCPD